MLLYAIVSQAEGDSGRTPDNPGINLVLSEFV